MTYPEKPAKTKLRFVWLLVVVSLTITVAVVAVPTYLAILFFDDALAPLIWAAGAVVLFNKADDISNWVEIKLIPCWPSKPIPAPKDPFVEFLRNREIR